jgi:serine/threonine protein kinase
VFCRQVHASIFLHSVEGMADTRKGSTMKLDDERTATGQCTRSKSATQELESEVTTPTQLTCYGSAPEEHWTELAKFAEDLQDQLVLEEESFPEVQLLTPADLSLLEEIAEGGQANVFLATCSKFSTPAVVKRLKYGPVNLLRLRRRMDRVMRLVRQHSSAICRVMAVGKDNIGNGWIVMERMNGDLRNLIDHGVRYVGYVDDGQMHYVKPGEMPFDYSDTIKMMMDIARGMEDLHSCGLIHRDLKASNVLVTPLSLNSRRTEVIGLEQALESFYFYVKVGDYESSGDVVGTGFWRPPEVLQALQGPTEPAWSREGDVYSFAMLCYELLTGCIPFKCPPSAYSKTIKKVLSGERPELPPYVNSKMRDLLHCCWHTKPQKRPGWITIVKSLEDEFELHRPSDRNPRLYRRMEFTPKVEEPSTESDTVREDQSVGSSSTGLLASSTEFRPDIDVQSAETSSTGVLEIEGPGARSQKILKPLLFDVWNSWDKVPVSEELFLFRSLCIFLGKRYSVKPRAPEVITMDREIALLFRSYMISTDMISTDMIPAGHLIRFLKRRALGKLAIIWDGVGAKTVITFSEERIAFEKKRAHGKVAVLWKASIERDSPSNLAKELNDFRMKLDDMEAAVHSRFQELIIAFDAAVKQDIALEGWAAQSLAASELFEAVVKHVNYNWKFDGPRSRPFGGVHGAHVQAALDAWHAESPEGYEAWMETRIAASAQEAWKVAKNALQQVEKIMAEFSVFQLKLHFLVWMFLIEAEWELPAEYEKEYEKYCNYELVDAYPRDRIFDRYFVDFESRHLLQCPQGKQIYDWWVVNRKEYMLNGEEMSDGRFVEMVGIIKKTKCKSQSLDMLVGGWKHSREE